MKEKHKKPLDFTLDIKSGVPFYKQIMLQVEIAIADGRLVCGDQLPTVRALAVELKVNPNTIARAYTQLEIRDIVTTQQGTGTFIRNKKVELPEIEREKILAELAIGFITKAASYGFSLREIMKHIQEMEKQGYTPGAAPAQNEQTTDKSSGKPVNTRRSL